MSLAEGGRPGFAGGSYETRKEKIQRLADEKSLERYNVPVGDLSYKMQFKIMEEAMIEVDEGHAQGGRIGFKEGSGFSKAMESAQDKLKTRALELFPWSLGIPFNELSPKHRKEVIDSFSPGELLGKAQGGRIGFWEGGLVGYSRGGIASL